MGIENAISTGVWKYNIVKIHKKLCQRKERTVAIKASKEDITVTIRESATT